ncbi:dynamin family protein [Dactylosporangium cerinum]
MTSTTRPAPPDLDAAAGDLAGIASVTLAPADATEVRSAINLVTRRSDAARLVAWIIGYNGAGKSSLINDYLGEPLLPTGVGETTAVPVTIVHGPVLRAFVVTKDDTTTEIDKGDIHRYAAYTDDGTVMPDVISLVIEHPAMPPHLVLIDGPGYDGLLTPALGAGIRHRPDVVVPVFRADTELRESEVAAIAASTRDVEHVVFVGTHTDVCPDSRVVIDRSREVVAASGLDVNARWFVNAVEPPDDSCGNLAQLRALLATELPGEAARLRAANVAKGLRSIARYVEAGCRARLALLDPSTSAAQRRATLAVEASALDVLRRRVARAHRREVGLLRGRLVQLLQDGVRRIRHTADVRLAQPDLPQLEAVADEIEAGLLELWAELVAAAPREGANTVTTLTRMAGTTGGGWTPEDFAEINATALAVVSSRNYASPAVDVLEFVSPSLFTLCYRKILALTGSPTIALAAAIAVAAAILRRRRYRLAVNTLRRDVTQNLGLRLDHVQAQAVRAIDAFVEAVAEHVTEAVERALDARAADITARRELVDRVSRDEERVAAPARALLQDRLVALRELQRRLR